jgi:hypothetical protein
MILMPLCMRCRISISDLDSVSSYTGIYHLPLWNLPPLVQAVDAELLSDPQRIRSAQSL